MRIAALFLLCIALAACANKSRRDEAIRQGIVDHLAKAGLNINGMEVGLVSVDKKGSEADATVSITPKGGNPAQGMSMKYHLEERGGAWVVTGRQDAGAAHGGAVMPEAGNPHATPAPGGKMPSPEDLPPAKK